MDQQIMKALAAKIPKNPRTGRVDLTDIMKYMEQHPEEMDILLGEVDRFKDSTDAQGGTIDNFNFASLGSKIRNKSFWCLQLETMGYVDNNGRTIDMKSPKASSIPGAVPVFTLYCYDDRGAFRYTEECRGLPDSDAVLKVIKRCIVTPLPPMKPELPWFFMLSRKLSQHAESLQPFLDSLPAPFHWRVETTEEASTVADGIHAKNEKGVRSGLSEGDRQKAIGNKAFERKNREAAVKAYGEAIECFISALSQKPDIEEEKRGKKQLAICYSNRAAAYLLPGKGQDPQKALEDAKRAEQLDPAYSKLYARQARAYQLLSQPEEAKDAIARALKRPDLENDKALTDVLIDLYTDGKGLSDEEGSFKSWILDAMINDKKSGERLKDLGGEWKKRLDAQFTKWQW